MPTRYRAEVVGSFLRPPALLQARADHSTGKLKLDELRAAEDRAILSVFEGQKKAGMQLFTDGELRRGSWLTDMADAVEGFVADKVILDWKGPGGGFEASSAQADCARIAIPEEIRARPVQDHRARAVEFHGVELQARRQLQVLPYARGVA